LQSWPFEGRKNGDDIHFSSFVRFLFISKNVVGSLTVLRWKEFSPVHIALAYVLCQPCSQKGEHEVRPYGVSRNLYQATADTQV